MKTITIRSPYFSFAAKAGEFEALMRVIENHPSIELRVAVIRLLASSGEPEIAPRFAVWLRLVRCRRKYVSH